MLTGYYKKQRKDSKRTRERYQGLSKEQKSKHQYPCEHYRNLSEEK